jgi:hypothetical protein
MAVSRIGLDWKPVSYLNPDITVELDRIANLVMTDQRLPSRDPYLIDVCLAAIREIQQLRAAVPKKVSSDFLGGPMS